MDPETSPKGEISTTNDNVAHGDDSAGKWYEKLLSCVMGDKDKKPKKDWKKMREERLMQERAEKLEAIRIKEEERRARQEAGEPVYLVDDDEDHDETGSDGDGDRDDDRSKNDAKKGKKVDNEDEDEYKGDREENEETRASIMVTKLVRGFLARHRYKKMFAEAVTEVEEYHGERREEVKRKRQRFKNRRNAMMTAKVFVFQYAADLLDTCILLIIQTQAITKIQKVARGYMCRRRLGMAKPVVKKKRPIPTRITPQIARRVWARKQFVPKGGWPTRSEEETIQYDINEFVDHPPKARWNKKVLSHSKMERNVEIILSDKNAWVGLPMIFEPESLHSRKEEMRNTHKMLLEGTSPFVGPQFKTPVVPKPPVLKGMTALRALGWNEEMVPQKDDRKDDVKRGYKVVDPYNTAALAADLATVLDGVEAPSSKGAAIKALAEITLARPDSPSILKRSGDLLRGFSPERSIRNVNHTHQINDQVNDDMTLTSHYSNDDASTIQTEKTTPTMKKSSKDMLAVGMGVWDGSLTSHATVLPVGDKNFHAGYPQELNTRDNANTIKLITPSRGALKPLSNFAKEALTQTELLPEALEKRYDVLSYHDTINHHQSSIFESERKPSQKRILSVKKQVKVLKTNKELYTKRGDNAMAHPDIWRQTVTGKLLEGAADLKEELRSKERILEDVADDPWSRSTYRKEKEIPSRVRVWPKKPKEFYKYRYSWLPQTMLKEAALNVYPETRMLTRNTDEFSKKIVSRGDDMSTMSTIKSTDVSTKSKGNSVTSSKSNNKKKIHPYPFH
jgi:hypothetical protein